MVEFSDMHMMVANPEQVREHVDTFYSKLFCSKVSVPFFKEQKDTSL